MKTRYSVIRFYKAVRLDKNGYFVYRWVRMDRTDFASKKQALLFIGATVILKRNKAMLRKL